MKVLTLSLGISLLASAPLFAQSKKELKAEVQRLNTEITELKKPKEADISNENAKVSYAIGIMIANNVKSQEIDSLDVEAMTIAFGDVLKERELKLQPEEAEGIVQQFMQKMMEEKRTKAIDEASTFLQQNLTKPGVKQTESGLQYKVEKEGTGKSPAQNSKVTVHYKGMLTDGTVFDSSIERGQPATFGVNQVIPGWTEALQLMKEGARWTIWVPYPLAYGEQGAGGGEIPPYATLIFEVELLKVE